MAHPGIKDDLLMPDQLLVDKYLDFMKAEETLTTTLLNHLAIKYHKMVLVMPKEVRVLAQAISRKIVMKVVHLDFR